MMCSTTDLGTALEWDTHEATVTGDVELAAAQPVHAEGHADGEIVVDDNVEIADSRDIEFEIDAEEEIGVAIDAAPRQSAQMQRLDFSNDTGSSSRTSAVLGEIVDGQGLDFSKAGEMDLCALQNDDEQHISSSVNLEKQGRIRKPPAWLQDYSTGQEFSDEEPGNTITLLKACVDASRFELIDILYQEMDERLISPNTVTQNIVLSGYGKVGMYDQMERVLSGMLESTACKPDVWNMNIILSVFGNKGHVDLMDRWYEKFRNFGIEPETRTFNILIGAYGKKRMYDKMSSVMEYMRKLQFPWTTSTYNNVIEAFADVGDAKNMEYTFDQMRAEDMKADTKTFCCVVNGYANVGLFHKVISSVQLAAKFEIPENTSLYKAVISACAKADDLVEMERVFKQMKDKQRLPDSRTYSIMVEAYRKEGMNDKIYYLEQEKQKMIANGALSISVPDSWDNRSFCLLDGGISFVTPWDATNSCKLLQQSSKHISKEKEKRFGIPEATKPKSHCCGLFD
ncbi:hypothetical protein POTOM_031466 [Populus tomentosa]|uniref:Pentatricopeptide repeat-containing protein n=1 Tax=Populus tomentosa TaxID=118781 RepID=A0A8X7ZCP7_POPTO|nr:hypothetical protein POTOM_031466 [Populus tomentosa]